jgi:hypothetical protein
MKSTESRIDAYLVALDCSEAMQHALALLGGIELFDLLL